MLKVSAAGEDHGHPLFVGGGDHFRVVARTTRLDRGEDAGFGGLVDAVTEREEGIAGDDSASATVSRFLRGDLRRVEPAHLARARAGDHAVLRENDRV